MYYEATRDASTRIRRGVIDNIIASESHVFYNDGITPIGVFFEKTHRKYIYYQDIPRIFIKALIAAEDRNFFHHSGFDFKAIIRALITNIKTGKVVQGGSTITQQTAKNIFKREKRSYKAKLKELIQAFLLERQYSKEEILEMYVNQFFVTGYGKGLRIASQYYFDKEAEDLDLVEAAFIAGSLKGPMRYNPFNKNSSTECEKIKQAAKIRKDYVLSKMYELNFITKNQFLNAREKDVPFKNGKITYRLNVILDYIREQLESDYFKAVLFELGVENIATSGINIHTSIDKEIQEAALMSLRTQLPVMDVMLNGYDIGQMAETHTELLRDGLKKSKGTLPFLSKITHIDRDISNCSLVVSWENGGGIIDYDGLKPMGEAWLKWKYGNSAVFNRKHIPLFLKNFHLGDIVPVRLMPSYDNSSTGSGPMKLILSKIPRLEGGMVVLQEGMVKAMVGGFFDRFFNRAVDAKRQMGSIFKPIVYTAALQLKWNSLDPLKNIRDLFQFENTSYFPQPDHTPKSDEVSIAWAGVKSENLATVWLLCHLTDHLSLSEFQNVMQIVGLDRKKAETYKTYVRRIRDNYGIVIDKEALMEAAFEESKTQVESDIIFGGHEKTLINIERLHYSIQIKDSEIEETENKQIKRFCYKRLYELNQAMKDCFQEIHRLLDLYAGDNNPHLKEKLSRVIGDFYLNGINSQQEQIVYTKHPEFLPIKLIPLTTDWLLKRNTPLTCGDILIDGLIHSETIELFQRNIKRIYSRLASYDTYSTYVLFRVKDFRTLVNLSYVLYLSKKLGISTRLDPVLSFPLGPDSISIIEAALAYQTIMTGKAYKLYHGCEKSSMVPIITKITDRDGETLWEYRPDPERILSQRVSGLLTEILKKVMEVGTGSKAKDKVRLFDIPIPTFGKTGTANRFTNSSFVGFLPGLDGKAGLLDYQKGYVIASYVGYDDNQPMKGEHIAIYGSSGALPLWIDTANAIVNTDDYKKDLELADLTFEPFSNPLLLNGNFLNVSVSPITGLPLSKPSESSNSFSSQGILSDVKRQDKSWELIRHFEPIQ